MKTFFWVIVVCLTGVLGSAAVALADTEAGEVLAVRKTVYLEREGKRNPAKPQMPLLWKDSVATDVKSRAKLYFQDDSILNLGELSRVVVEEYLYKPEEDRSTSIYKLLDGTLKVVVGRSDLEIHTPTAVAAARGTKFIVIVKQIKETGGQPFSKTAREYVTKIMVIEGVVKTRNLLDNIQGTVTIRKGQMTTIFMSAPPENPRSIDPAMFNQVAGRTVVLGQFPRERMAETVPAVQAPAPASLLQEMKDVAVQPQVEQQPTEGLKQEFTPVNVKIIIKQ